MGEVSTSLNLEVEIETTNTADKKSIIALLDSGCTGVCIDWEYAKSEWFNLKKLSQPIPVYNVDGTLNSDGSITEVVSLILRYKNHLERTTFFVSGLGGWKLILGHSWLCQHNPEIDWSKGDVRMSCCPPRCCSGCREEVCQERIAQKAEAKRKDVCSIGPIPEINHDSDEDSEPDTVSSEETISVEKVIGF